MKTTKHFIRIDSNNDIDIAQSSVHFNHFDVHYIHYILFLVVMSVRETGNIFFFNLNMNVGTAGVCKLLCEN
jgi:hypothetical protein